MFEGFFGELVVGIEVDEFACFLVKVFEFSLVGGELVFVFFLVLVLKVFDLNEELLFEFISGDRGVVAFLWIGFGEFSIFDHVVVERPGKVLFLALFRLGLAVCCLTCSAW